jgi:hypothetical protein
MYEFELPSTSSVMLSKQWIPAPPKVLPSPAPLLVQQHVIEPEPKGTLPAPWPPTLGALPNGLDASAVKVVQEEHCVYVYECMCIVHVCE